MFPNNWLFKQNTISSCKKDITNIIGELMIKCSKPKGTENIADMIFPSLWLGNIHAAANNNFISENNIDVIINISKEKYIIPHNVQYYNISIEDLDICDNENYKQIMFDTMEIIYKHIISGSNILVHCKRGHHRSASVVVLYLMEKYRMSMYDAIYLVKTRRPTALRRINCMVSCLIDHEVSKLI